MSKFIPKEKMSKKAKKQAAAEKRNVWVFSPATRKIDSRKIYNRKKISRTGYDDGTGDFLYAYEYQHRCLIALSPPSCRTIFPLFYAAGSS